MYAFYSIYIKLAPRYHDNSVLIPWSLVIPNPTANYRMCLPIEILALM